MSSESDFFGRSRCFIWRENGKNAKRLHPINTKPITAPFAPFLQQQNF